MKSVKIYSTPTCHFCNLAKDYFKENNIPFENIDLLADRSKIAEMMEISGQGGVPVIVIDGKVTVGFDKPAIEQLLNVNG